MKPLCVVSCPIDTFSGYGARSRDFVKGLIQSKGEEWDIKILPQRWGDTPWNFLPQDSLLKQRFIGGLDPNRQPDIWIQVTVPNEFQPVGRYNIGVTAGIETNIFPAEFLEGMNRMNLNLVSSRFGVEVAQASSFEKRDNKTNEVQGTVKLEKPLNVLFEGLNLDVYNKKPQNSELLKDIHEDFCFLFTGHWLPGKFGEDRKDVATLITTFLETFKGPGKKKPALILKTNHLNYSLMDKSEILKKIHILKDSFSGNLPNIYLIHGEMTDKEMNQLNNDNKVKAFISFTKGEGFGRPLLEQAITGKPVITTNWSGQVDFLKKEYNCLIGGELKNVHKSAANQFLLKDSKWFSIDKAIAGRAMKDVVKKYKHYFKNSRKQTQYLKDNFSFDKMVERINELMPVVESGPQVNTLSLPKLKKTDSSGPSLPKLKLPKLNKVDPSVQPTNKKPNKLTLPKLKI